MTMSRSKESRANFAARVQGLTGMTLADIPWGQGDDVYLPILCKRGDLYVVGVTDGQEDEDGCLVVLDYLKVDLSEEDDGYCGYCQSDPCGCNGFGGPKGLTRHEGEAKCGYCGGSMYEAVPDEFRQGFYRAVPQSCGCDGFGGDPE
jgi:hypothetical protein